MLPGLSSAISHESVDGFHCSALPHRSHVRAVGRRSATLIRQLEAVREFKYVLSGAGRPEGYHSRLPATTTRRHDHKPSHHDSTPRSQAQPRSPRSRQNERPDNPDKKRLFDLIWALCIKIQSQTPAKRFIPPMKSSLLYDTEQRGYRPLLPGDELLRVCRLQPPDDQRKAAVDLSEVWRPTPEHRCRAGIM